MKRFDKYTAPVLIAAVFVFFALILATSCAKRIYVPVETVKEIRTVDSVYFRDTTIQYKIEKEYLRDYTGLLDTLRLSTNYSDFTAYVDTTNNLLKGKAKNREKTIDIPAQLENKVEYRDSIVTKEVPVEVEKPVPYTPKFWKFFGWVGMLSLVAAVLLILRKLKVF